VSLPRFPCSAYVSRHRSHFEKATELFKFCGQDSAIEFGMRRTYQLTSERAAIGTKFRFQDNGARPTCFFSTMESAGLPTIIRKCSSKKWGRPDAVQSGTRAQFQRRTPNRKVLYRDDLISEAAGSSGEGRQIRCERSANEGVQAVRSVGR